VKFLLDQNLSPQLVQALTDLYPGSVHVRDVQLQAANDVEIWAYASQNRLTILSKDSDFHQRSFLFGHPPKVVWIQVGNCSTSQIEALLRSHYKEILAFDQEPEGTFLALG
jgi:predicted nuclease of predicted toxin-antitoxin system